MSINRMHLVHICLLIFGACSIWLGAQFEISIPGSPVPQSAQTLVVILLAVLLPRPYGSAAVLLYLIAGLIGLPVFSDGGSGWSHLIGKTGGYLFGFLLASLYLQGINKDTNYAFHFIHYLIAHTLILFLGYFWLSQSLGFEKAWEHGVSPFIWGAFVKSALAVIIVFSTKALSISKAKYKE